MHFMNDILCQTGGIKWEAVGSHGEADVPRKL